jgi:outer membrane biosynthesis protein TonB
MIPRTLVPVDVRPVKNGEAKAPARRLETYMDERTLVPAGLPDAGLPPLDGHTSIPAHLPLDSLVPRTLVPRGMPAKPIERFQPITEYVPIAVLDERVVVPAFVEPAAPETVKEFEHAPKMTPELRAVVEPDIFITGDPNLLIQPEAKKDPKWDALMRALSVAAHIALLAFVLLWPKIFPYHPPSEEDIKNAQQELNFVYMPPEKPVPPAPTPKLKMNREILKRVVPEIKPEIPAPAPVPTPTPERPPTDLPEAPKPRTQVAPTQPAPNQVPTQPTPSHLEPVLPAQPQNNRLNLGLNQASPGKAIDSQLGDAINRARVQPGYSGGAIAPGGGGGTGLGQGVQILSDTEGVDFNPYITRLLATLKRNWLYVMPESARWDKGVVFTAFQINRDGSVSAPDPILERTSGKQPLDNAAMSAIRASNPFEPLPSAFHGPYLRLRIAFIYNIPPEQINLH